MDKQDVTFRKSLNCPNCGMDGVDFIATISTETDPEEFAIKIQLDKVIAVCGICANEIDYEHSGYIDEEEEEEGEEENFA